MSTTPLRNFDQAALTWDDSPTRMQLAADIRAAILERMSPQPDWRVLDFGCGTGLLSLPWANRVKRLTGADLSSGMLEVFRDKAARHGLNNVDTLPLDHQTSPLGGPFDLIVSSMTMHHIEDIPALLRRWFDALAPGGQLLAADLDLDGGRFHSDNTGVFHFGFERAWLEQTLTQAGFSVLEICTATNVRKNTAHGEESFSVFLIHARR